MRRGWGGQGVRVGAGRAGRGKSCSSGRNGYEPCALLGGPRHIPSANWRGKSEGFLWDVGNSSLAHSRVWFPFIKPILFLLMHVHGSQALVKFPTMAESPVGGEAESQGWFAAGVNKLHLQRDREVFTALWAKPSLWHLLSPASL